MVHDEHEEAKWGDIVRIRNCPPKSARKRFEIIEILESTEQLTRAKEQTYWAPNLDYKDQVLRVLREDLVLKQGEDAATVLRESDSGVSAQTSSRQHSDTSHKPESA